MHRTRTVPSAAAALIALGLVGVAAAPVAGADSTPSSSAAASVAPRAPSVVPTPVATSAVRPTVSATPAAPSSAATDIRVPAGRADIGRNDPAAATTSSGHDALLVGLACGAALLLVAGSVTVVARRSR